MWTNVNGSLPPDDQPMLVSSPDYGYFVARYDGGWEDPGTGRSLEGMGIDEWTDPSLIGKPQRPRPISEAPAGEPVLGVWENDIEGLDFESVIYQPSEIGDGRDWERTVDRSWVEVSPDGWLPLPVVDVDSVVGGGNQ